MSLSIIIILIVIVIVGIVWVTYNSLITAKMRVGEAMSQIDVQLKRRADLIPNLVETVKGYARHEKELLETVTAARANLLSAKGPKEKAEANNQLASTLKSLFAVAENYPNLKASENFLNLQEELSDTENKVAYSRQFYNSAVMDYNTKLQTFPTVLFANIMRFAPVDFFQADNEDKKPMKVNF